MTISMTNLTSTYIFSKLSFVFVLTFLLFFLSFFFSSSSSWPSFLRANCTIELARPKARLQDSVTFLPLKDLRRATTPFSGSTWFMSSISDARHDLKGLEQIYFPSELSKNRLLCLSGHHPHDGTENLYGFAYSDDLPPGSTLLSGLTFVSENYYDYENPWHSLSAIVSFVEWHMKEGCLHPPERWVLYHWGELRSSMGSWLRSVAEAVFRKEVRVEGMDGDGPVCFEKALVNRREAGPALRERKEQVYDMIRCKARVYCGMKEEEEKENMAVIRMTLLLRVGARSFKDEETVIRVFGMECSKVHGCELRVARPNNLSFCDQVKLMAETNILVSPHGAQLTNMIFMNKNSSIMEFFPYGWLDLAGIGQYVYRWLADWSGMRHRGEWRDSESEPCQHDDHARCFAFYKDKQIGHDETFFANWAAAVLAAAKEYKTAEELKSIKKAQVGSHGCQCLK